jgi:hypothetical protein
MNPEQLTHLDRIGGFVDAMASLQRFTHELDRGFQLVMLFVKSELVTGSIESSITNSM